MIRTEEMDAFLEKSMADTHVSRSERKHLSNLLETIGQSSNQINAFRTLAFEKELCLTSRQRGQLNLESLAIVQRL